MDWISYIYTYFSKKNIITYSRIDLILFVFHIIYTLTKRKTEEHKMNYTLRYKLGTLVQGTYISRKNFDEHFTKTKEKVTFTFQGWDGKSYHGESRRATVYRCDVKGFEDARFVKVGKAVHCVDEDSAVLEEATGEYHKTVDWVVDVWNK
jgi:hypothetical protein